MGKNGPRIGWSSDYLLGSGLLVGGVWFSFILASSMVLLLPLKVVKLFLAAFPSVVDFGHRVVFALGRRLLRDERDSPFLYTIFGIGCYAPLLFGVFLWIHLQREEFSWFAVYLYNVLLVGPHWFHFALVNAILHEHGHKARGLFVSKYWYFNVFFTHVLAFFYGHVPDHFQVAHLHIHHKYDNGPGDLSTTWDLNRLDSSAFILYAGRFAKYFWAITPLFYYLRTKKIRMAWRAFYSIVYYYGILSLIWFLFGFRFLLGYFLLQHISVTIFLAAINYVWHAFTEPTDPMNQYVNSITILSGDYNIFNSNFHAVHHIRQATHWTSFEDHFRENIDAFRQNAATLFDKTDPLELFLLIVFRQYDTLAQKFVDLSGNLSHEEKKSLIMSRLRPVEVPTTKRINDTSNKDEEGN